MNAGTLDRPVTIQQLVESVGASRFPVEAWTTLFDTAWMSRADSQGSERFRGGQLSAPQTTRWQMRYAPEMDPERVDVPKTRRLIYQGRTYDIIGALLIDAGDGVELTTVAKVG